MKHQYQKFESLPLKPKTFYYFIMNRLLVQLLHKNSSGNNIQKAQIRLSLFLVKRKTLNLRYECRKKRTIKIYVAKLSFNGIFVKGKTNKKHGL